MSSNFLKFALARRHLGRRRSVDLRKCQENIADGARYSPTSTIFLVGLFNYMFPGVSIVKVHWKSSRQLLPNLLPWSCGDRWRKRQRWRCALAGTARSKEFPSSSRSSRGIFLGCTFNLVAYAALLLEVAKWHGESSSREKLDLIAGNQVIWKPQVKTEEKEKLADGCS